MKESTDSAEFQCGKCVLRPRPLSALELTRGYLPLRFSTLYCEKHWAKQTPIEPLALRDHYDDVAWPFGIYLDERLIAAIRLISADSTVELASGQFISDPTAYIGRVAEVSKAMVDSSSRNCGLFTALFLRCRLEALSNGIDHLFISVIDSERVRAFLLREGFQILGSPFRFEDHTIAPKSQAIVLHDTLFERGNICSDDLSRRLKTLYRDACKRLGRGSSP